MEEKKNELSLYDFLHMVFDSMVNGSVCSRSMTLKLISVDPVADVPVRLSVELMNTTTLTKTVRYPVLYKGADDEIVGIVDYEWFGERPVFHVIVKVTLHWVFGNGGSDDLVFKMDNNTELGYLHIEQVAKLEDCPGTLAIINKYIFEGVKHASDELRRATKGLSAITPWR